jgi:hypothetical protein
MGRLQMNAFSVTAASTDNQFLQTSSVPGFKTNQPAIAMVGTINTGSACSAGTYSGSVLNFWNQLVNTERGVIAVTEQYVNFYTRSGVANVNISSFEISNVTGATKIGYQTFERINLGLDLMNQVQIQPAGLATQQATNAASVSAVGAQGFTVSTLDANTTQAFGLAEYLANTLSDTTKQRFVVSFTDLMQSVTTSNFSQVLTNLTQHSAMNLTFRVPGAASDTTVQVVAEGFNVSTTPAQTTITAYFTPLTYYSFFILGNAVLGVLGSGRLGW